MRSGIRKNIKSGIARLTRGQLMNYAAAIHDQPTPFPAKGPGRYLQVRPDDTFIVSYPRSGNTWLRFLVANLVHRGEVVDYGNIETIVPDIYVTNELSLRKMAGPRILKSHEAYDPRYRRVIYAVRDPRGVIVSQFNTLRRLRGDLVGDSFEKFVDRQLAGDFDAWFGSWSGNVCSWIHQDKADVELLVVKYEDVRRDTLAVATRIVEFLGIETSEEELRDAVANSSHGRMRDLYESSSARLEKAIGEGNAGHLRPNMASADPGMTPRIEQRIRDRYGRVMASLGYA
jgi:hypothetical protein